jgi:hypothetical protein
MRLMYAALAVLVLLTMAGCGSQHVRPNSAGLPEEDRYVAMNLFINTNDFVSADQARMLRYLGDSLKASGRFSRLDGGMLRWPYTLQVRYEWKREDTAADFAAAMGSAATLMIVPAPITEVHHYSFEVVEGTETRKVFEYEEKVKSSVSIFNMGKVEKDRQESMDRVLARFFAELDASNLVPHLRDLKVKKDEHKPEVII